MNEEDPWYVMYEFGGKCTRASQRCKEIAQTEEVMGYTESALTYQVMAAEITAARVWLNELYVELVGSKA